MKRFVFAIAIILSFFFVSTVFGETYIVKGGDSLSKIASKYSGVSWKDIYEANRSKVKKPSLIFVGQTLTIPAKTAIKQASVRYWKKPGGDPFTKNRDKIKAIKGFSLPQVVKTKAIEKFRQKDWEYFTIKAGYRFQEMYFGNYKKWTNVIVAWPKDKLYLGRRVSVEYGNKIYYIAYPFVCHNISWWSEDKPAPAPVVKVVVPVVVASELEPVEVEESCCDYDAYLWAGRFVATSGKANSNYYGGKFNWWFLCQKTSFGLLREGLSTTYNGWDGGANDGFAFHGKRFTLGPIISWTREDGSESTFTVQMGKQKDVGRSGDTYYHSKQWTDILHFNLSHDVIPTDSKIFDKLEFWADANFDIDHSKTSNWKGWKIDPQNDPASDKTNFGAGMRAYTWKTEKAKGGFVIKVDHALEDHHLGVNAGLFIADIGEYAKAGIEFRNVSNSKYDDNNGNAIGVGVEVDLGKFLKNIAKLTCNK